MASEELRKAVVQVNALADQAWAKVAEDYTALSKLADKLETDEPLTPEERKLACRAMHLMLSEIIARKMEAMM